MLPTLQNAVSSVRDRSRSRPNPAARLTTTLTTLAFFLTVTAAASADVFHLKTGGTIEGQNLGTNDNQYSIRTTVGVVRLPTDAVERVEPGPTPFEEYDQRREQLSNDPAAHVTLAEWCAAAGLHTERKFHLEKALELDPNHESARRALGYVRVAGLWIDGRTVVRSAPDEPSSAEPDDDPHKLAAAIQGQWRRRIRAIRQTLLESSLDQSVKRGVETIREISDPLAILPLTEELSSGDPLCRDLLVEQLQRFPQDEATLNLAIIALVDPLERIRQAALTELVDRDDPRVVAQYRAALDSGNDIILRRAAHGLGELGAAEAVPDLIGLLTAQRNKWVEVPVKRYLRRLPRVFTGTTEVYLGSQGTGRRVRLAHVPQVGVWGGWSNIETTWRYGQVTVYRTEVLEALKQLTGKNFGFERDAWLSWYQEYKP